MVDPSSPPEGMRRVAERHSRYAVVALVLIPVVVILGGMLAVAIDPEIAAGHPNYVRNFRLLAAVRTGVMLATGLVVCGLWLACCVFVLKAKGRSLWWLPLAIFGPFGLAGLALLANAAPGGGDVFRRFFGRVAPLARVVFEIAFFVAAWSVAFEAMGLWRDLMITLESARTGVPAAAIIAERDASGGMWAFSEGNEVLFLVALFYVLRPVCAGLAGRFGRRPAG